MSAAEPSRLFTVRLPADLDRIITFVAGDGGPERAEFVRAAISQAACEALIRLANEQKGRAMPSFGVHVVMPVKPADPPPAAAA